MMRRMFLRTVLGALGTAPVWAAGPDGARARSATAVGVACTGAGGPDLHAALCTTLRTALARRYPDTAFVDTAADGDPPKLALTLHVQQVTDHALSARLGWTRGDSPAGSGPDVTAGTRDKAVGAREFDMLVKALLKVSDLPL